MPRAAPCTRSWAATSPNLGWDWCQNDAGASSLKLRWRRPRFRRNAACWACRWPPRLLLIREIAACGKWAPALRGLESRVIGGRLPATQWEGIQVYPEFFDRLRLVN